MAEEKLPLPEKDLPTGRAGLPAGRQELPPPHDMQLAAGSGASQPPTNPTPQSQASFFRKYGSKKWLLPLIILVVVLLVVVGAAAFMGSSDDNMTRREKRMERQEKRQQKQGMKQKNNKNKKKRNKNTKNGKAKATSENLVSFTYGSGADRLTMQYPGNMKVTIVDGVSTFDSTTQVPLITFSDNKTITKMKIEPNANNLSAAAWQANLAKKSDLFSTPTEVIAVAQKEAVIQHVLTNTANWVAYVPMNGKMLFVDMNYSGGKNKAKDDFVAMLETVRIGGDPKSPLPTAPMPTLPPQTGM